MKRRHGRGCHFSGSPLEERMCVKEKNQKKPIMKAVISAAIIVAIIFVAVISPDITVETLLAYTPQNPVLAAGTILFLYGLKSITVVFPLIVLEIAAGHLFSTGTALLINSLGMLIVLTLPYWMGRFSGMETVGRLMRKYPKFELVLNRQQNHSFFLCFFLRIISCLPGDIVTMYFGATRTPFFHNLIGGIFGVLPGMILATILGANIQNPDSPMFWIAITLTAALSAASFASYYFYKRKQSKNERPTDKGRISK